MTLGGHLVADTLALHGAGIVFTVPGNSVLATLDGLHGSANINVVVCRHEGGAAYMAQAYGRLTGEPGVCLVTRGPGAANASIGILTAQEEATPLLLLVGDVGDDALGRDAFQEIDTASMLRPLAKWVIRVPTADRIPELISRAYYVATSGRPGPVVLVLPENVQLAESNAALGTRYRRVDPSVSAHDVETVRKSVSKAERPLMILGGSHWTAKACTDIASFAKDHHLPVAVTFRRQDLIDNDHPNYIGTLGVATDPALIERVRSADLLLVVGGQLGEVESVGYELLSIPRPTQQLIHVATSGEELGKIYQPDVAIVSSMEAFASGARALAPSERASEDVVAGRDAFERFATPPESDDDLDLGAVMSALSQLVARDAIITMGAGNYTHWALRYFRYREPGTLLAPIGAPMGYSTPAAVAAGLVYPGRDVVAIAGDGCFLMNGQELATAAQYRVKASFLIVNNGMLASVRMRQERLFPERVIATDLENPNFVDLAKAYGVPAVCVTHTDEFAESFSTLRDGNDGPILIELRTHPDTISPDATLEQLRAAARKN
jgi:acetolactate synthase-1/2/3 large subunit